MGVEKVKCYDRQLGITTHSQGGCHIHQQEGQSRTVASRAAEKSGPVPTGQLLCSDFLSMGQAWGRSQS